MRGWLRKRRPKRAWAKGLGLLLQSSLLVAPSAEALPPNTHVVVIGNNHGAAGEMGLLYAERDADQVADVLRRLGGVPSDRIQRVIEEEADAVRRVLLRTNEGLRSQDGSGEPSALIVFYSGHADATALHLGGSAMPFDELRALVKSSPADIRLLVIDACRSGGVSRVKGVKGSKEFKIDLVDEVPQGFAIITSSTAGEDSQESDRFRGSFFSHHLVNGLRGAADRNGDGEVTLGEAYAYAYDETLRSSGSTLHLQHPTYSWDVRGRGDLVLTRPRAADRQSGLVRLGEPVPYLFFDARAGGLFAEVHPSEGGALLSLPARAYRVQQRRPDEYLNYEIRVAAQDTVDLSEQPYEALRYDRLVRKGGGEASVAHGLLLMGGGRGELVDGEGPAPLAMVGYSAAMQWATVDVRLRFGTNTAAAFEGLSPRRHNEYGLLLSLQRFVDFDWASVAFGAMIEGALHEQRFSGENAPPSRRTGSFSIAVLAAIERSLFDGLSLRAEAGPISTLYRGSDVSAGREVSPSIQSSFTWWLSGGLIQRF